MTASSVWPDEETLIPDLLQTLPQTRSILDRHGLRGCGGPLGPMETLGYFARAHEVPLQPLLAEIRSAARQPQMTSEEHPPEISGQQAGPSRSAPPLTILDNYEPQPADAIYRPFFKSGIAVVLSLGAAWGAYLLLRIAITGQFAAASLHDVNAHGHAQIFGWVGLFVMGFAYQAFPRFKQTTLAWPRLAFATLWMMLIGVVVRSVMQPMAASVTWAWWPAVAASILEVLAIGTFAAILWKTWNRSGQRLAFYDGYIASALVWFVVQAVYESIYLAATLAAEGEQLVALVTTWQPALRDVQIHGFALLMILGVSQRIFHHFYGFRQPNQTLSRALLVVLNLAIAGEAAGLVLMSAAGPGWAGLWYLSVLVLAISTAVLVADWRIFARTDEADRSLKFLRSAYVWLLLSLTMLAGLPIYQYGLLPLLASGGAAEMGFSHAYYGAIRHAITVGFVSLMIVGVSSKVVPTLNGIHSRFLSPLWGPFLLINVGCGLRVAGQTATDFTGNAFAVAGISGLLEVTGLALWGVHMWLVMSGRARLLDERVHEEPVPPLVDGASIQPRHTVGEVLEQYPQLLEVFVEFGFTALTNPQLRGTIARVVTIERACRRMDVPLPDLLGALNESRECSTPVGSTCTH